MKYLYILHEEDSINRKYTQDTCDRLTNLYNQTFMCIYIYIVLREFLINDAKTLNYYVQNEKLTHLKMRK